MTVEARKLHAGQAGQAGQTERLYYEDSHMREFDAHVLACRQEGEQWLVQLDRTAFFPEGGGQCADCGILEPLAAGTEDGRGLGEAAGGRASDGRSLGEAAGGRASDGRSLGEAAGGNARGGLVRVLDVQERDGCILHRTDRPLEVGCLVRGELDWVQRFSNMQQHTGEHIVSGLVHRAFGYENVGFHLGKDAVTMDFNGLFPEGALEDIEIQANQAVWANLPVLAAFPSREELAGLEYRSKLELEEDVRIVTIPGVDACACCAPHVGRTGEIGCIKIVDAQHYKGGTRVSILCGSRALADYREKQRSVREISVLLSAPQRETSQAAARMKEELGGQKERCAALSAQLAVYKGAAIPQTEGSICLFEELLEGKARRELANLAAEKAGRAAAVFAPREDGGYDYILASGELDMRLVCREMNGRLGGRGGGSARMAQGCVYAGKKEIEEYIHGI